MSMSISVTVTGDDTLLNKLENFGAQLVMMEGAMNSIGKELTAFFANQVFASQGGILGENWADLSPAYAVWKAKMYPGRPPLVRTGEMQNSFVFESDQSSVTIANNADYFAYHQSDQERTSNLPRRTMMAVSPEVNSIIVQIIDADVSNKISMLGL